MENSFCSDAWDCGAFNPEICFQFSKTSCGGSIKPTNNSKEKFIKYCIGKEFKEGKCGICGKTEDENGTPLKVAAVNNSVDACLDCWRNIVIPRRSEGAKTQKMFELPL